MNRQPGSVFLTGEYDGLPLVQGLLSRTGAYVGFHIVREHGAITKILDPSLTREALKDSGDPTVGATPQLTPGGDRSYRR